MNFKLLAQTLAVTATLLIAQPIQAETFYFHNDHLGTPQALTDDSGTVVWQGNYSPFGEVTETTDTVEQNIVSQGSTSKKKRGCTTITSGTMIRGLVGILSLIR